VFPSWKWERLGFSGAGAPSPSGFFLFQQFLVGGGGIHDNWDLVSQEILS